jgi:DNA topoisomerase IA
MRLQKELPDSSIPATMIKKVRESFDNLLKHSRGLAEAGRSRHILDFIYGVNLSRVLSQLFKVGSNGSNTITCP